MKRGQRTRATLLRMARSIQHRGPDDEGYLFDRNLGLGHLRLSIIDLSEAAHQPMFDETGRYSIIYNGEIYNYLELREQLAAKGRHVLFQFRHRSDPAALYG